MPSLRGGDDDAAPAVDRVLHRTAEVRRDDQRRQVRVLVERLLDPVEELRADDAAAAPDGGQVARGDAPVVLGAAGLDLVEALRVGDDLRRVERLADVLDELLGVAGLFAEVARMPDPWSPCAARPNPTARGRTPPRRYR